MEIIYFSFKKQTNLTWSFYKLYKQIQNVNFYDVTKAFNSYYIQILHTGIDLKELPVNWLHNNNVVNSKGMNLQN